MPDPHLYIFKRQTIILVPCCDNRQSDWSNHLKFIEIILHLDHILCHRKILGFIHGSLCLYTLHSEFPLTLQMFILPPFIPNRIKSMHCSIWYRIQSTNCFTFCTLLNLINYHPNLINCLHLLRIQSMYCPIWYRI